MNEENLSAIEIYMNRVFKFVILVYPAASLYSGLTYSTIKLLGFYQNVSWFNMLFFDITCLIYFLVGLHFFLTCETAEGYLKPNVMRHGKIFLAITELTMWNLITYLLPHKEFWGYAAIFIMFVVFLLDHKFTLIVSAEIMISAVVSWFVRGDFLLPARDELFVPNIILRFVDYSVVVFCLWFLTYLVEKRLAAELEKLADYDALTLLHNRRSMKSHIDNVMKQAQKGDGTFTLLMCDLDNFKSVNDTYGHDCGDLILKTVANIISCDVRKDDIVFRYGGEEILVMVRADNEVTKQVAERIRHDIENEKITYNNKNVGITVTIGVASYKPNATVDELIKLADDKLYIGKNNGKNQVVSA